MMQMIFMQYKPMLVRGVQLVVIFAIYVGLYLAGSKGVLASRALLFFSMYFAYVIINAAIMLNHQPELIGARSHFGKAEKWDKAIMLAYTVLLFTIFYAAGLDAMQTGSLQSLPYMIIGVMLFLIGGAMITWAMYVNKFFESGARIQKDRKQTVIKTGPYAIIRHPGYAGMIMFFISIPLIFGSVKALEAGALIVALLIIRTYLEDSMLRKKLIGYGIYACKVRYRLVPLVW